jgi:hypothetical protein
MVLYLYSPLRLQRLVLNFTLPLRLENGMRVARSEILKAMNMRMEAAGSSETSVPIYETT